MCELVSIVNPSTSSRPVIMILGSGPNAIDCIPWGRYGLDKIVAINNAWQVRSDWDHLVHAGDFDRARLPNVPLRPSQSIHTADEYVGAQNHFGGFVYAGGTMAFTAAYWALYTLKPRAMAFLGCDMTYPTNGENTHFYGTGTADPLRPDVTLQSLEAKATRLEAIAMREKCVCVNLSVATESRLVFPRATHSDLSLFSDPSRYTEWENRTISGFNLPAVDEVLDTERRSEQFIESGKYWKHLDELDPAKLRRIDSDWLSTKSVSGRR